MTVFYAIVISMQGTKEELKNYIIAKVRQSSDFPAMSNTVTLINKFKSTEASSVSEFANIILNDFALTSKVLKVVNSVGYAQFNEVTTISRAIILLGFENVRNLALTLMLFDHFQKNGSNNSLMDTIVKSYYSAILAQRIAHETGFADQEESFICSLLHLFGKIMVSFYLPEYLDEINAHAKERGSTEDMACLAVMGMTYDEVGSTIAKEWSLPTKIILSMRDIRSSEITSKPSDTDRLSSIATLSNNISKILSSGTDKADQDARLARQMQTFKEHFSGLEKKLPGIIASSTQALMDFSTALKLDLKSVPFGRQLMGMSAAGKTEAELSIFASGSLQALDSMIEDEKVETPETILTKGIQDINNSIVSNCSLNDIVRIALETMYRGMQLSGASRVLFLIKDTRLPLMAVRFGFGNNIEQLKSWFKIELNKPGDLFNLSIAKQGDFVVKDIDAPDIRPLLPDWYKKEVPPTAFIVLLPIIINSKPLGMFYIEGEKRSIANVTGGLLNYLKIMRDQTVLAIKQKQSYSG